MTKDDRPAAHGTEHDTDPVGAAAARMDTDPVGAAAARIGSDRGTVRGSDAVPDHLYASFPRFAVACGEEASDPIVTHDGRDIRVDQLAASGHLARQDRDLADVAALGVTLWRYGMPWRSTEPRPGEFDWTLWDRAFESCQRHGLVPIVDLCHFGLPDHYRGFCDTTWVDGFVRYVEAFLDRYHAPRFFTPVNEPMITAMFSAHMGMWNDRRASRADYMTALANVTLANLEALARIDSDRSGWWIGAEGFGCHIATTDDDVAASEEARALEQLVWDLHLGVEPPESVADVSQVVDAHTLDRIRALAGRFPTERSVVGHDFYPVSVTVHDTDAARHGPTETPRPEPSIGDRIAAYEAEARRWYARYGRDFWVAETSNLGLDPADGPSWLDTLVASLDRMAADGLPVRGICWYSRGDQYDWHTALTVPIGQVTEVGLFDADRRPRPIAASFAELASTRRSRYGPN